MGFITSWWRAAPLADPQPHSFGRLDLELANRRQPSGATSVSR
jgi:hypothetical protein